MWGLLFSPGSAWRIAGGNSSNDPLAPSAPVLTWDTGQTDNTPTFTADFDDSLVHASGDIDGSNYDTIHLEWDTDSGFGSVDNDSNTLDAGEITAGEVEFTTGTLADGTWYARCRHEHVVAGVSHFSPWSNTVSQTIDTTGPTLSSATGTQTGDTTASLSVSTNEGNGTLYWVVDQSATPPNAAQVKAGNDQGGSAADDSGSQAVSGTGVQNISGGATGLTAGTTYYAYFMHEDALGNQSSVGSSSSFTTTGGAWSPSDLGSGVILWLEADDLSTLFQNVAGSTAVTTDGQSVGTWLDKSSNNFDLTAAADDTTRPAYGVSGGVHWVRFDASNDQLRRAANLNLMGTNGLDGAYTLAAVFKRSTATNASQCLISQTNSASDNAMHRPLESNATTGTTAEALLRNDGGGSFTYTTGNLATANGMKTASHVLTVTDSTTLLTSYLDGVSVDTHSYTRLDGPPPDTYTFDRFSLGAVWRSSINTYWGGDLIALVAVNRVLNGTELADLTTYLGNKAGLTL